MSELEKALHSATEIYKQSLIAIFGDVGEVSIDIIGIKTSTVSKIGEENDNIKSYYSENHDNIYLEIQTHDDYKITLYSKPL